MRIWWLLMFGLIYTSPVWSDEGMWTFDNFPLATVNKAYGTEITPDWLDHIRLSTLRLSNCSAAFVSTDGLILTNHHCVESCLAELSSKEESLIDAGYLAPSRTAERRCDAQLADVLVGMENVTAKITSAVRGLDDAGANTARKSQLTELEQACERQSARARSGKLKCQAVTLYGGGQYFLYKYKRFDDIRMVFAPEEAIAAFGGDPDNFQFPRWSLDFSLLRAYERGKPARTPDYLEINFGGPAAGEVVFVAGNPGATHRLQTRSQLAFERDVVLPGNLLRAAELRGRYIQFGSVDEANERLVEGPLNSLENGLKVRRKLLDTLHDDDLMARKRAAEKHLRDAAPPAGDDPWQVIDTALTRERTLYLPYTFVETGAGFNSILFRFARLLVRGADEREKPNSVRLREYTEAALPRIEQQLFARVPVHSEVELLTLSSSLQRMREWLGADHPMVRRLLAQDSPANLAVKLVAETKLDDPLVRQRLWEGGMKSVQTSRDPMIEFARSMDDAARLLRKQFEDEVEAPIAAASARIAAARFQVYGTAIYPDASFTPRLNYGTVQGWTENGNIIAALTHLDRLFERATGTAPFRIPQSWMNAKNQLDMQTPFCISTTNDIIGGNSGSPLLDAHGRIVGVMFDGNIHSISGDYWFDSAHNRAVALHPAIMREALAKVYGAAALLMELTSHERSRKTPAGSGRQ